MRTPGTNVRDVSEVPDHDSGLAERADDQRTVGLTPVFQKTMSKAQAYLYGHLSGRYFDANSAIKYGALARARDAQRW